MLGGFIGAAEFPHAVDGDERDLVSKRHTDPTSISGFVNRTVQVQSGNKSRNSVQQKTSTLMAVLMEKIDYGERLGKTTATSLRKVDKRFFAVSLQAVVACGLSKWMPDVRGSPDSPYNSTLR